MCKRNLKFYICFKKIKYTILFLFIIIVSALNIYKKQKINITDRHNQYPRIYCIVLTTPQYLKNKTKLVHDLWVKKCDGHKFISTIPEELINNHNKKYIKQNGLEINIGFDVLQPPNYMLESYNMLTEKTLNAFKYIYQHNPDFDFYLKADDDTYIFMENLRSFLAIKNRKMPIVSGYRYKGEGGYHSGGAGYVLTNEAMKRLGNALINNQVEYDSRQIEDIYVERVLRTLDVHSEPTIDENGRERFHPFNIRHHYEGSFPGWMQTYPQYPVKKVNFLKYFQ